MDFQQTRELMKVALGEAKADLAIVNGDVVNVYTNELTKENAVLIKGDRIAYVGKNFAASIGVSTEVLDASGKVVIPGLIDGHTHIDSHYTISEILKYAIKGGVTTIITEVDEFTFPFGYPAIFEFLKSIKDQPIKIFITIPPMISSSRSSEEQAITVEQLRKLLKRREVVGLGEAYWGSVIAGNKRVIELIIETINAGKTADGHSAGARDNKLQAYVASGISSCHEPIKADDVRERLRLGLFVPIREGEMRKDLESISKIKDENIDLNRLVLSTDGVDPGEVISNGYLESVVQKAINLGFEPIKAIRMATLNPAQQFKLDNRIGGIAPGKIADIVIIPDLHNIKAEFVISNGKILVRDGQPVVEPKKYSYPGWIRKSVRLTRDFTADDFKIPAPPVKLVKTRIIEQVSDLVTREAMVDIPVSDGQLKIDIGSDLLKIAAIERMYKPGKNFTGFIRGFKMKSGAIANSGTWDSNDIIVVGASEADMALAVNRLRELKGGIVFVSENKILAELAMPIGGIVSEESMEIIASKLKNINREAVNRGFPYSDIRTSLDVMASPAIPFLRICEEGLFSVTLNKIADIFVD